MSDTTYVDGVTLLTADTMNDLNRLHYTIFGDPATLLALQNTVIPARGYVSGGTMVNGTDAVNDINFGAGFYRDSTNAAFITCSALVKQLDAAWAAGTNAGGRMSAAAITDTTYHCYAIRKDSDGSGDYGFDTSATAPTMPAGYTYFRRIGSIIRAGATILAFIKDGNLFQLSVPALETTSANPGIAAVTQTLASVPAGINVTALLNVTGSGSFVAYLSDLATTDAAPSATAAPLSTTGGGGVSTFGAQARVRTNTSAQIRTRISASGGGQQLFIATRGWLDTRGRDL